MTRWFYSQQGQTHGPYTAEELKELLKKRLLQEDNWLWPEGSDRKDGAPARAALDFPGVPKGKAGVPDWLEDVAKQGTKGPVPLPAPSHELPDWLEDLRLWYGWEPPIKPPVCAPPPSGDASSIGPPAAIPVAPHQPSEAKLSPPASVALIAQPAIPI